MVGCSKGSLDVSVTDPRLFGCRLIIKSVMPCPKLPAERVAPSSILQTREEAWDRRRRGGGGGRLAGWLAGWLSRAPDIRPRRAGVYVHIEKIEASPERGREEHLKVWVRAVALVIIIIGGSSAVHANVGDGLDVVGSQGALVGLAACEVSARVYGIGSTAFITLVSHARKCSADSTSERL